jgi:hypothetical protein
MENIHVQCIKFGTPHEQCSARRPVPSIDDDVRGLAGVAPWSQNNGTPHKCSQANYRSQQMKYIYKRNRG